MDVDDSKELRALVSELQRICARLPAAEQYVMVHHPAFRVGKKPFVVAGIERAKKGATFSVNLGREVQPQLLDDARFTRTPYIGQHGWVTSTHGQVPAAELRALVIESWKRVANGKQLAAFAAEREAQQPAAKKKATKKVTRSATKRR